MQLDSEKKAVFSYGYSMLCLDLYSSCRSHDWEMIHYDAREIQAVISEHPRARRISGFPASISLSLVVEIDLPYRDSQVAEYGDNFARWNEEDFSRFVGSLTAALPLSPLTLVVQFLFALTSPGPS